METIDPWAKARELVATYGADARLIAWMQAEEQADIGDADSLRAWRRVLAALRLMACDKFEG